MNYAGGLYLGWGIDGLPSVALLVWDQLFSVKRTRQKICVFYIIDLKSSIFKTGMHQRKVESIKYAAGSHLQGILLQGQCSKT